MGLGCERGTAHAACGVFVSGCLGGGVFGVVRGFFFLFFFLRMRGGGGKLEKGVKRTARTAVSCGSRCGIKTGGKVSFLTWGAGVKEKSHSFNSFQVGGEAGIRKM